MKTAVLLVAHGSRAGHFQTAMERVARDLRKTSKTTSVTCAYLEITPPSIEDAIDDAVRKGARIVKILPYFVLSGRHVMEDLPRIVTAAKDRNPDTKIILCSYLGYDPRIASVVKKRLSQAKA